MKKKEWEEGILKRTLEKNKERKPGFKATSLPVRRLYDPEDIRGLDFGFRVGDNLASRGGDLFWFSPLKVFQRLLFHTPLVYGFILASYLYHDMYWWPAKGKPLTRRIHREDPWGQLFSSYPK